MILIILTEQQAKFLAELLIEEKRICTQAAEVFKAMGKQVPAQVYTEKVAGIKAIELALEAASLEV